MRVRLFFLFLLICGFIYAQEKRLALVIGNANYDKGTLKNPVNDALLMKETFEKLGFDVILKTNVETRTDFINVVEEYNKIRKDYTIGFVYYAGHGVQIGGDNYLLPTKELYETENHFKYKGVPISIFTDEWDNPYSNEVNVLILDACRNNPLEKQIFGSTRNAIDNGGLGLAEMKKEKQPTGSIVAFSTAAGQTASDGKTDEKNSFYCKSLAKNMLLVDVSIRNIFGKVSKEIYTETKQYPEVSDKMFDVDFYLTKSTYADEIISIDSLIDEKKYDLALEKVSIVLTKSPNNKKALLRRGRIEYNKSKDYNGFHLFKADTLYPNDPDVYEYLGRYFYTIGKFKEAIKYIDKAIEIVPNDPNLFSKKAVFHQSNDEFKEAEIAYNNSILFDDNNATRYENRSSFYIESIQEYNKALVDIEQAIKIEPLNKHYWYKKGYISFYLGNEKGAIIAFKKSLSIDSNLIDAITWLGKIFELKKDYFSAISEYEKGIALEKTNPISAANCYTNRAEIYAQQGKLTEALQDYTKAIELDDKNGYRYYTRALFYEGDLEDYNNALIDFSKAIELAPTDVDYLYQRGVLYKEALNKNKKALDDFEKILEIDSTDIDAINYIGVIYEQQGNTDLVIENYNKCIALENTNPNSAAYCYSNRAGIYAQQGKLTEALQDYTKAIELDNKNGDRYYTRALFYEGYLEDYDNALIDFSKAIELAPTNVNNLYQRGVLYKEALNKNKKALDDFEKILEIDSTDIDALNYIGIILKDEGKYDLAIAQFEKGIALEKTNPTSAAYCYSNRAAIYAQQEKLTEALQDYTKAIELDPKNAEHYFYRAEFNTNNLNKPYDALVDYSIGISLDSSNTFGWFQRGLLFSNELNDEKSAIRDFEYLLKLDSNDVSVLNWLGVLHGRLGEDSIEFEYYNRILQVQNPTLKENNEFKINLAWAYNNLAYMFQKENNNAKTLEYYGKAIENDPYEPLRHYERAWFNALYLGDFTSALNDINNAIKFDEKNSYWLLNRAKINLISKNYNAAKKDFNKLVENNSNSVSYTSELANFYSIINENELANFYFDKAQRIDSNSMVFLHLYTDHLIRNEIWGSAKKTAQKAISNNLHDTIGYFQLGLTYLSNKNFVNALTSFVEAENIIEFSERIEEIDESDESQLFLSDIQRKISEIYMLLGEIELSCSYTNKAIQSLNNETRSKKSEHLKLLIDMKANCQN